MRLKKRRAVAWIQSFLEPVYGKRGLRAQPASPWRKESVGTQQRWGKHEKRQRRTHSRRDEGGSAANRVRRLISLLTKHPNNEVTHSIIHYVTIDIFFCINPLSIRKLISHLEQKTPRLMNR
jgi:hypothetical protein